jgi:hypothetical protein
MTGMNLTKSKMRVHKSDDRIFMVHPVLAYFLDKKHQQQNVPGFKYKSPVQIAGPDHLLQIQTCKAELSIFSLTKNAYAFL